MTEEEKRNPVNGVDADGMPETPQETDTLKETDKKCDKCGGTMIFDPATGKLICEYCGASLEIEEELPEFAVEIDFDKAEHLASHDWGAGKKSVTCNSCGAESVYDELQISDVCPYCGSNLVTDAAGTDAMAPGGVCGFAVTVKQAAENFGKWIRRRIFAPKSVRKYAKPDAFKGVYLPYWTFDTQTVSSYSAKYGRVRTTTRNGKTVTHTDWYSTSGVFSRLFDDLLVSGTDRYDKKSMSGIEPFDTASSMVYKPEYIAGFVAERYSVGLTEAWSRGMSKIRSCLESEITDYITRTCRADKVASLRISTDHRNVTFKYLMLPVWMSSFRYKEKSYTFMVNGQTGKVGGRAPVSPWKVAIAVIIGLAIAAGVLLLIMNSEESGIQFDIRNIPPISPFM